MNFPTLPEHITVDFLTDILNAKPGEITGVTTRFVGDAMGNTSDVHFAYLARADGSELPASLAVKMIPQIEGAIETCKALKLFEREILNYRMVAGPSPIRTPELIWSDYDPETSLGVMVMEDCSYCDSFDQTDDVPTTLEELEAIIDCAADLHARWWDASELQTNESVLKPGHPIRKVFSEMVVAGWDSLLSGGPGAETIPDSGKAIARLFAQHYIAWLDDYWPTEQLTMQHLDFRVDNLFFDRAENRPLVFDWQATSVGPGVFDLAYLLAGGYVPEFRRQHEMALLERYHQRLVKQGVTDYSLEQVKKDYLLGLVFNLWVIPFTAILEMTSEQGQALTRKIIGGMFAAIEDHHADELFVEFLAAQGVRR